VGEHRLACRETPFGALMRRWRVDGEKALSGCADDAFPLSAIRHQRKTELRRWRVDESRSSTQ
jgi:hypothetical protein